MTASVGQDAIRVIDGIPRPVSVWTEFIGEAALGAPRRRHPHLAACLNLRKGLASQTVLEKQGRGTCSAHAPELEPPLAPQ